jgi:integrase
MLKPVKRPKSPYYVARGTINGRQIERSTGCTKLADARAECARIEAEIRSRGTNPLSQGPLTVSNAIAIYRNAGGDGRFLAAIERHLGDLPIAEINNAVMRRAANILYPGRAEATIRRQLYTPMKAIINCAADDDLCPPARLKSPKGGNKRIQFFTPEQAEVLLQYLAGEPNQYIPALVTALFGQGMRMGEALSLDGTDVNLDHRYAILRDTKNGEERMITLIPRVLAAWSRLPTLGRSGPLFRRVDGTPFPTGGNRGGQIKKPFVRAVEAAGLDPATYTPHICRHSWATWYYDQTKDVLRLKAEGGWKSEEYQRYTKLNAGGIGAIALECGWDFMADTGGQKSRFGVAKIN